MPKHTKQPKLTKLGDKPTSQASKSLEVFPNPAPQRDFLIHMQIPEFTCLCPKTGQPDFATLYLDYIPDKRCVELKSLKLYIWSFRNEGKFHEAVTNEILDDIVAMTSHVLHGSPPNFGCAAEYSPRWSPNTGQKAGNPRQWLILGRLRMKRV